MSKADKGDEFVTYSLTDHTALAVPINIGDVFDFMSQGEVVRRSVLSSHTMRAQKALRPATDTPVVALCHVLCAKALHFGHPLTTAAMIGNNLG